MTLGERIAALRSARGLSQDELAARLEVSRQSVSKWETDASVPELSKLLGLSREFGVSLDTLVKGETATEAAPPEETGAQSAEQVSPAGGLQWQWVLGGVLLALGLVPLALVLHPAVLIYTAPAVLCGLVCLTQRRRLGLKCGWYVWLWSWLFVWFCMAVSMQWLLRPSFYRYNAIVTIVLAWAQMLALGLLVWRTVLALGGRAFLGRHRGLAAAWAAFAAAELGAPELVRSPLAVLSILRGAVMGEFWWGDAPTASWWLSSLLPPAALAALLAWTVLTVRRDRRGKGA